jgi:hypothetical protein
VSLLAVGHALLLNSLRKYRFLLSIWLSLVVVVVVLVETLLVPLGVVVVVVTQSQLAHF